MYPELAKQEGKALRTVTEMEEKLLGVLSLLSQELLPGNEASKAMSNSPSGVPLA